MGGLGGGVVELEVGVSEIIPFAIKNLLNEERCFGAAASPYGLAAAPAWGRRPPKAGGGPTKYHRLAFRNSLHRIMGTYM
jgi:hypothetical protein